ncbi:MAG TPA: LytTR family DNA-binding domain-containing protein [Longimicrobium sp.]|nr:LytTR family DNA-binding domain-containing protein [Longimicrobium sp.]
MTWRAVVVDDEALARERLRTLLAGYPSVELVAECGDGVEAVGAVAELRPDLLFLDVQMPELDGFGVLRALDGEAPLPEIVFVTAYDRYALQAFEVHALDYLLKPFTRRRFYEAMEHVLARLAQRGTDQSNLAALIQSLPTAERPERIAVRTTRGVEFVRVAEVARVEAEGNYVKLHTAGGAFLLRRTLKALAAQLDPRKFVQVHRSALVNVDRIARLEPWFHGEFVVVMDDGARLTSSRTYSANLRRLAG